MFLAAISGLLAGCHETTPVRNVLLIVVDTLRADHLGVYGYNRPTSPHLDRQADRGVVFERALTTSPWTVPAIASMLTGLLPSAHGGGLPIEGMTSVFKRTPVAEGIVSVTQRLSETGFATFAIVGNPFLGRKMGIARGFDTYRHDRYGRPAEEVVDRALDWIGEQRYGRFFVMLHFMDPHLPHNAPEPYRGRFTADVETRKLPSLDEMRVRGTEYSASDRHYFVGRYDEEIAYLDDQLERLFRGLDDRWSDTLVILTSDHGEEILDHQSFDHGHTLMQELLHVPLILWSPGLAPRRVSTPVSVLDIAPTILDALGQKTEGMTAGGETAMTGRSLLDLVSGRGGLPERDLVAEILLYGDEQKALIRWPHKLVLVPGTGSRRLVDLEADPGEHDDLSADRPDLADRLEVELRLRVAESYSQSGAQAVELDEETRRELEALGYVD